MSSNFWDWALAYAEACHGVLQVSSMMQAAQMLVHCDPHTSELLDTFAVEHGFPSEPEMIADLYHSLSDADWALFWQYTERVNPFLVTHVSYVPIHERKQSEGPSQLSLY